MDVAGEFAHSVRFEGGGMVGAFPGAVEGEVALNPFGAEHHGSGEDKFVGDFHITFVVAADFGDYFWRLTMHDVVSLK